MRPGPIRPGDLGYACYNAGLGWIRFNEARADSPGRSDPPDDTHPRGQRFNEARADSPGRFRPHPYELQLALDASMRPGPIRPGDIAWGVLPNPISSQLQ